jgi:2-polyprenyl-6-methoxyphenol hydroxylase-like FAD-dependent oxidoreductase
LYEASQLAEETGAAIHLAPNSNGLLRRYGIYPEQFGAVTMEYIAEYTDKGVEKRKVDLREPNKMWQHPWQLVHRKLLHETLKKAATGKGVGKPAVLKTSRKVLEVDPHTATLVFADGEKLSADLVVGADGIYVSF